MLRQVRCAVDVHAAMVMCAVECVGAPETREEKTGAGSQRWVLAAKFFIRAKVDRQIGVVECFGRTQFFQRTPKHPRPLPSARGDNRREPGSDRDTDRD